MTHYYDDQFFDKNFKLLKSKNIYILVYLFFGRRKTPQMGLKKKACQED